MITLKLRSYSKSEIAFLDNMLTRLIGEIMKGPCHGNCKDCNIRHLCIDLQSAQLYADDTYASRQG